MVRLVVAKATVFLPVLLCGVFCRSASAQGVHVQLTDGSTRVGLPDRSTDAAHLRLRRGSRDAYIVYEIDWARVKSIS